MISKSKDSLDKESFQSIAAQLFKISESRGKEAAGFAFRLESDIAVYKKPYSASQMIRENGYKQEVSRLWDSISNRGSLSFIGHCRLATNGSQTCDANNQPVAKDRLVGVHNGIAANVDELWRAFPQIKRKYDIDSEIILSLIQLFYQEKQSLVSAVQDTFKAIEGAASVAVLFQQSPFVLLATNTGSLYTVLSRDKNTLIFASEKFILQQVLKKKKIGGLFDAGLIQQIKAGRGQIVNSVNLEIKSFDLGKGGLSFWEKSRDGIFPLWKRGAGGILDCNSRQNNRNLFQYIPDLNIKRCTKCILPETFPGISFDENGVCSICRSHKSSELKGKEQLEKDIVQYKKRGGEPDCLVTFSGGRDSSYGLHYIKNVLGMNPIAFTYDWGMVTDLARRNQARICGQLGIEHIIISADIAKKRNNIRKNVKAWLKKPDLGLIPLLMAGDKQFFYYANKLMKQNNLNLIFQCENERLENTRFKSGFCGVSEGNTRWANISLAKKLNLAKYYGKEFLTNPAYLNSSLADTFSAYCSTYFIKHSYLFPFRYIGWDEQEINSTLIGKYNWETAADTKSTWRIGDGTAPFYNYIYCTVAGFTENDTFRSNQIREGLIAREQALAFVRDENKPRPESMQWYADQVGFDLEDAIKIINNIPKKYKI